MLSGYMFINQLASSNPLHAVQVNGFFCGLLDKNIGLNDEQINGISPEILSYDYFRAQFASQINETI